MSPKRSLPSSEGDQPGAKRVRMDLDETHPIEHVEEEARVIRSIVPTHHYQARTGIQRSIAMVLKHDGFDTATPEALESFTEMVETCSSTTC